MPTYLVIKKSTFYAHIKILSSLPPSVTILNSLPPSVTILNSLPPSVTILKNDKPKFKAALRKYLYTQSFYSGDDFFMCKDDS